MNVYNIIASVCVNVAMKQGIVANVVRLLTLRWDNLTADQAPDWHILNPRKASLNTMASARTLVEVVQLLTGTVALEFVAQSLQLSWPTIYLQLPLYLLC
jgi:hypothetical protein